jgi:DNA repair protein SbcC/Rad50
MIVKKLKLENIRSYKSQVVEFPLGRTLFEGDIGSGKSTILMAIEFALFGLGSEKPGSLLKAGETEGLVSIIFESGGREYMVQRRLVKKRNSYVQDDCVLRTGEEHMQYSASEIKERVLEILDFNEPSDPKAQSVIYRYAIYTPQEEIKNVLALKPDLRLQTLRKAFRIEDYKVTAENAKNLHKKIERKARDFTSYAADIPDLKEKVKQLASWTSEKSKELETLRKRNEDTKALLTELKEERDKLQARQLSLKEETGMIETLMSLIQDKKHEIESSESRMRELRRKIELNEPKINQLQPKENPSKKSLKEMQTEIRTLEDKEKEFLKEETQLRAKLEDYKSILEERICPTCDRPIEADSFSEKLEHKQGELNYQHQKVKQCSESLAEARRILDMKRDYDQDQQTLTDILRNQGEYTEDLETNRSRIEAASRIVEANSKKLDRATAGTHELKRIEIELSEIRADIERSDTEVKEIAEAIAKSRAQITEWERETKDLEKLVKKKAEQKEIAEKLNEHLIWIQDYFIPTVEGIEKQVLMNINLEFDSQFTKWFSMLVDDPGKEAKIDEEFTPIIQQDGIDQDVSYLSGGEKTSVALAYRLALNNIVRKVSTGMQSNVLILDEPTDGFSKEQLSKVREILDELDCPQIILVSHEKELESFADQIFRVTKINGTSTISVGN